MLDERDEFLISRLVDGDLSAGERAHVEALLAESEAARAMLREYRQLSGLLRLSRETPNVDFEAMREDIAAAVEQSQAAAGLEDEDLQAPLPRKLRLAAEDGRDERESGRLHREPGRFRWAAIANGSRKLAIAASLVLAVGLAWSLYEAASLSPLTGVITATGQGSGKLEVSGPRSAGGGLSGSMQVRIGPAAGTPLVLPPSELDSMYGRVEVLPDSVPALNADPDRPF
jgi:anti-sigma factor RsiW